MPEREPLGETAVVDEDDRRAVRPDEVEDRRVDRRPDRAARPLDADAHLDAVGERRHGEICGRPQLAHVLDGDDDLRGRAPCAMPASTSSISRPEPATKRPISSSGRCVAERPTRWNGLVDEALEPLERERQVRAALRSRDGVHLVEDHRLDAAQRLARLRGEQQEERLGGRDEDVGRRSQHPAALLGRRVAGAHGDARASSRAPRAGCAGCARCRS